MKIPPVIFDLFCPFHYITLFSVHQFWEGGNIKYKKIELKNKITNIECQILKSDNNDTKTSLESEKAALENKYEYYCSYVLQEVSYDDIENVRKLFRKYLLKKDLPICRKLIHSFVDKIMVYPDYVEAVIKTN